MNTVPQERPLATKAEIREWWATYPMTCGNVHGGSTFTADDGSTETLTVGTREFFERLDRTFYGWNDELHDGDTRFGRIFPYAKYRGCRVLEIGCGLGTMAMNWARHGARITAIDLNPVSVAQTSRRFELLGLNGEILHMDANALGFADATFDYVYSFGVLHHSPDLSRSIAELFRVLRSGGGFGVMVYNRASVRYWHTMRYVEGFLHRESRFLDRLQLASRYTDGGREEGNPHTWPVTRAEMLRLVRTHGSDATSQAFGSAEYAFPPKVEGWLPAVLKNSWARRWGWSLWTSGTKRG